MDLFKKSVNENENKKENQAVAVKVKKQAYVDDSAAKNDNPLQGG